MKKINLDQLVKLIDKSDSNRIDYNLDNINQLLVELDLYRFKLKDNINEFNEQFVAYSAINCRKEIILFFLNDVFVGYSNKNSQYSFTEYLWISADAKNKVKNYAMNFVKTEVGFTNLIDKNVLFDIEYYPDSCSEINTSIVVYDHEDFKVDYLSENHNRIGLINDSESFETDISKIIVKLNINY